MKKKSLIPFFTAGDVGGLAYGLAGNIVNYIIVIATLTGMLGWPDEIVFGRVIPGMSIGLMLSGIYYAYMAHKLSKKEQRADVTALPSGVSTPAMFIFLYGVIVPLNYAINDPELVWSAAIAACFLGGAIEFLGGIIGPYVKKALPRAALLGTIAGVGFIWMATQGIFDVFGDPILGMPILLIAVLGLFAGYMFPGKIPPLVVAIVGGIVYALILGRVQPDFSGIGFFVPNPATTFQSLLNGFAVVAPYLAVVIPVEIYNFIETMDNVASANAAGDNYNVREAQFADGACTMISAIFGGVVPNTVWLGHPGLKKQKAGAAYSWMSGVILGAAGIFGLFVFINSVIPAAICAITFLWCAIVMVAQAFKENNHKYFAAVAIAMLPAVGDYMYSQITGAVGLTGVFTETVNGLAQYGPDMTQAILDAGVMWNGVPAVHAGAIVTGLLWGSAVAFIIDRRLDKTAWVFVCGAVLALFGFINSASLGFFPGSPYMLSYAILAILCFVFHLGRKKWFKAPDDYEYV